MKAGLRGSFLYSSAVNCQPRLFVISGNETLTLAHSVGGSVDTVEDDKPCECSLMLSGDCCDSSAGLQFIQFIFLMLSSSFAIRFRCSRHTGDVEGPHGLGCSWASVSCGIPSISPYEQRDVTYRFARGTCDRGEACWRLMERQWVDMRVPWEMGVDGSSSS